MALKKMPKINLYRNIGATFIVFTLLLLGAVFFFFYSQTTIIVTPALQEIDLSFNLKVKPSPAAGEIERGEAVSGELLTIKKTVEKTFEVLSTKTVSDDLVGRVEIKNDSSAAQPLLKTTQLQADNGAIVRTAEYVVVPAGGRVTVGVFPKNPDNFSEIKPGRLTIIKLPASLQENIYGLTSEKLTTKPREVKVLASSDLNRARKNLHQEIREEIRQELQLAKNEKLMTEIVAADADKEISQETGNFKLKITVSAKTVRFNENQLLALLTEKVESLSLSGVRLEEIKLSDIDYLIIDYQESGEALVKVDYTLEVKIATDNSLFARDNLVNQPVEELKSSLTESDLIKEVEVVTSPYWSKTTSKRQSRIKVIVK